LWIAKKYAVNPSIKLFWIVVRAVNFVIRRAAIRAIRVIPVAIRVIPVVIRVNNAAGSLI
jgi:hypothetical protein